MVEIAKFVPLIPDCVTYFDHNSKIEYSYEWLIEL